MIYEKRYYFETDADFLFKFWYDNSSRYLRSDKVSSLYLLKWLKNSGLKSVTARLGQAGSGGHHRHRLYDKKETIFVL